MRGALVGCERSILGDFERWQLPDPIELCNAQSIIAPRLDVFRAARHPQGRGDLERLYDGEKQFARLLNAIALLPGRRVQVLTRWKRKPRPGWRDSKQQKPLRHRKRIGYAASNTIMQSDLWRINDRVAYK